MKSPPEQLDFRKIFPVFLIVLIDLLGLTIIIPLLPLYATSFGASAFTIGLLGAAYPLMQLVGAPILGRLSDRYGRKPVLMVSQMGTLAGFLMLGFANALWLLFLSRLIDGISGANFATAQAAIADSTTEKSRTQGLGLIGAAFGLGFIFGPVIAFIALSLSGNNYRLPAFVASGFSLISILLTWLIFTETLPAARRGQGLGGKTLSLSALIQGLKNPSVGFLLVLMFAQQIAFGGLEQLLSLFTLQRLGLNASGNAVVFVFVGLIVVTVQGGLIGTWSRKMGDRRLVYLGLVLLSAGLLLTALTPRQAVPWYSRQELARELGTTRSLPGETPPTQHIQIPLPDDSQKGWLGLSWLLAAMLPAAIGGGLLHPGINSLITKRAAEGEVGGMLGLSAAFLSAGNALAPLIGGALFQGLGAAAPFLAGGLLIALLYVISLRQIRPGVEEARSMPDLLPSVDGD